MIYIHPYIMFYYNYNILNYSNYCFWVEYMSEMFIHNLNKDLFLNDELEEQMVLGSIIDESNDDSWFWVRSDSTCSSARLWLVIYGKRWSSKNEYYKKTFSHIICIWKYCTPSWIDVIRFISIYTHFSAVLLSYSTAEKWNICQKDNLFVFKNVCCVSHSNFFWKSVTYLISQIDRGTKTNFMRAFLEYLACYRGLTRLLRDND